MRRAASIAALLCAAGLAIAGVLTPAAQLKATGPLALMIRSRVDRVAAAEERYQAMQRHLPKEGRVSYVASGVVQFEPHSGGDLTAEWTAADEQRLRRFVAFCVAQYTLAPVVLVPVSPGAAPRERVVLADFDTQRGLEEYLSRHPLRVVAHLAPGAAVLAP